MSAAPQSTGRGDAFRGVSLGNRDNPEARMSLIEHIRELRKRLVRAMAGLVVGMVVGWFLFARAWLFITEPFCKVAIRGQVGCGSASHQLIYSGIFDAFFLRLQVAFVIGLVISSPVWLYQLWAFIAPGLYARERRWSYAFVGAAVPLFCLGGVFAYFAMSRALNFLLGLTPQNARPLIQITTYFSYAESMLLVFGLAFELPLVLVLLNLAGVLSHAFFKKWRRVMLFGVFVFAGAATPSPDWYSMLLLAIPCLILVELAEVFIWLNDRRRARRAAAQAAASAGDYFTAEDLDKMDAGQGG